VTPSFGNWYSIQLSYRRLWRIITKPLSIVSTDLAATPL